MNIGCIGQLNSFVCAEPIENDSQKKWKQEKIKEMKFHKKDTTENRLKEKK